MKKRIILMACILGMAITANAQFKIHSDGKISINTTATPNCPISINDAGNSDFYMSYTGSKRFLYAATSSGSSGSSFILRPTGNNSFSFAMSGYTFSPVTQNSSAICSGALFRTDSAAYGYGAVGIINPNTAGVGLVGSASLGIPSASMIDHSYAGFFLGDVKVTGNLTTSSSLQGTLITPSAGSGTSLQSVMQNRGTSTAGMLSRLQAVACQPAADRQTTLDEPTKTIVDLDDSTSVMLVDGDEENLISRQSKAKTHYALDIDQLEEAFPDLVYELADGTKAVNYVEMVPLLVECINELSGRLSLLEGSSARQTRATMLSGHADAAPQQPAATGNRLYQNTPNPFREQTTIRFRLADDTQDAYIYIFDMTGKALKQLPINSSMQSVTIQGYELSSGMYLYSLVINGQEIDTKRMILSK